MYSGDWKWVKWYENSCYQRADMSHLWGEYILSVEKISN